MLIYEGICVEHYIIFFFSTFKLPTATKNPLHIIFDDFGIR